MRRNVGASRRRYSSPRLRSQFYVDTSFAADDPDTDDGGGVDWTEHGDVADAHVRYADRSDNDSDTTDVISVKIGDTVQTPYGRIHISDIEVRPFDDPVSEYMEGVVVDEDETSISGEGDE